MNPLRASPVEHLFTVDVEEYFQVSAFDDAVSRSDWAVLPSRVALNIDLLLELLDRHEAAGTFFILGWLADRHPGVVRKLADAGHEIASHGWWHRRVTAMEPEEFRSEVRSSKAVLEDVSGRPVFGFRAPNFSIIPGREWAFDILLEEGYRYDSSLFPIRRPGYGYPQAAGHPHYIGRPAGQILEFPLATLTWQGMRMPAAGGGYFRHFPYALTRQAFEQCSIRGTTGTFYIHSWEIDHDQPRMRVPWLTKVRHYRGLSATCSRLDQLLSEFRFTSVERRAGRELDIPAAAPRRPVLSA